MGSGKSTIARLLAKELDVASFDLDDVIEKNCNASIVDIFKNKGEVFFRKQESIALSQFLDNNESFILSLGGGTPCYGDNMMRILASSVDSVYLNASVTELYNRLHTEKSKRPLLASLSDTDLMEFIAKHLFERNVFYRQSKHIVDVNNQSPQQIVESIKQILD